MAAHWWDCSNNNIMWSEMTLTLKRPMGGVHTLSYPPATESEKNAWTLHFPDFEDPTAAMEITASTLVGKKLASQISH
jgi:hypothetical protein